ncbi:MAG: ABC transporter [Betaproteobacteria bacterium HGW-Betaproteobacteria-16]|nr:MAG: ABC transporter [Betaproteobacteria bacterium HGW-Betaproteobacteria-16]
MDQPPKTMISVTDLCFSWPERPLFDQLSFDVPAGVSLVVGDDGVGKSTLLALLAGALSPHSGRMLIEGIGHLEQPDAYRQNVFWIDPHTDVHNAITANDFLKRQDEQFPHFDSRRVASLVHGFSLEPHMVKPLYMLSTGSRRKVWWVAAFAANAPVVLLDQPFAALDAPSSRFLRELLDEAAEHTNRAWLLADHGVPQGVQPKAVIEL